MARMKRILITVDDETLLCLKRWRLKEIPASEVIRMATKAFTRWKQAELAPKPESLEGVDIVYDEV